MSLQTDSQSASRRPDDSDTPLRRLWTLEAIRLRESRHGPLDDSALMADLRSSGASPEDKIMLRAQKLAQRTGLDEHIERYAVMLRWAQILLCVAALLLGFGLAAAALAGDHGQVNLAHAWLATLGPHFIALILWVLGFFVMGRDSTMIGQLWLSLTGLLSRRGEGALAAGAVANIFRQERLLGLMLSKVSHLFWLCALVGALLALLYMLSTRSYHFVWATTILPLQSFDTIAGALGSVPELLGFPNPSGLPVQRLNPGNLGTFNLQHDAAWSAWLLGQIIVYGLLPRLILTLCYGLVARRRLRQLKPDFSQPDLAALRERLRPQTEELPADAAAPALQDMLPRGGHERPVHGEGFVMAGIELRDSEAWPPFVPGPKVDDAGNIHSREQRHALNDYLSRHKPLQHMLLVCESARAPDRGQLNYISQIMSYAGETTVYLFDAHSAPEHYRQLWETRLEGLGIPAENIHTSTEQLQQWINQE